MPPTPLWISLIEVVTMFASVNVSWEFILICFTDLVPGDFVHVIGDAHVYLNHIRPLQEQLKKLPKPFPVSVIHQLTSLLGILS